MYQEADLITSLLLSDDLAHTHIVIISKTVIVEHRKYCNAIKVKRLSFHAKNYPSVSFYILSPFTTCVNTSIMNE